MPSLPTPNSKSTLFLGEENINKKLSPCKPGNSSFFPLVTKLFKSVVSALHLYSSVSIRFLTSTFCPLYSAESGVVLSCSSLLEAVTWEPSSLGFHDTVLSLVSFYISDVSVMVCCGCCLFFSDSSSSFRSLSVSISVFFLSLLTFDDLIHGFSFLYLLLSLSIFL